MASMLRRNVTKDFRIVCFTDDPSGISDPLVDIHPIWPDWTGLGLCWRRVMLFTDAPWFREIVGPRFYSIDLDVVITGNIDAFLGERVPFRSYRNTLREEGFCTAFFQLETGAKSEVYNRLTHWAIKRINPQSRPWYCSDQDWANHILGEQPTWGPEHGIHNWRQIKDGLPAGARIVCINGPVSPADAEMQSKFSWIKEHWR